MTVTIVWIPYPLYRFWSGNEFASLARTIDTLYYASTIHTRVGGFQSRLRSIEYLCSNPDPHAPPPKGCGSGFETTFEHVSSGSKWRPQEPLAWSSHEQLALDIVVCGIVLRWRLRRESLSVHRRPRYAGVPMQGRHGR